ncbi:dienelactone hydrolase [Desulfatibacillum aliphaticivorans]|uniref:Dienelactone hydrolase n=1 Tax=Desulfatibacillum aliphaticivorans TaxID=218208 RepID=B8FJ08_DESAL|nr:alpha/beta family hydrolase [Desulfatibacillum aliphaticivorans]ACL04399.1 dienelactone hydrolase [Desulfatibacillum aliphaticivorans]
MSVIEIQAKMQIPDSKPVSVVINAPEAGFRPEKWAMVLAHGAGNDMNHSMLANLAEGLAAQGHLVMRFNFPYREEGKKRPDGQKTLEKAWIAAFKYLKNHPHFRPQNMIAAGKSMGGRVASQLQASGAIDPKRMIFYGFPLHAPGKKDEPRSSHFKDINVPTLFFAGTRDSLCDLDALQKNLVQLPLEPALEIVEGGDHSFKLPKNADRDKQSVQDELLEKTIAWLDRPIG